MKLVQDSNRHKSEQLGDDIKDMISRQCVVSAEDRERKRERGNEGGREGIIKAQSVLQEIYIFWRVFTSLLRS